MRIDSTSGRTRLRALLCLTLLAGGGSVGCGEHSPPRPDVALITIDTLRADRLGAYGSVRTTTPHLDALAADSVVFTHAIAPMPLTRPSHASLFTGLYPREHGVLNNVMVLPDDVTTLAETLAARGYATAGFTAVSFLDRKSGLGQGFETYSAPRRRLPLDCREIVRQATDFVQRRDAERPLFLWVHFFEPHQPYEPPHPYDAGALQVPGALRRIDYDALLAIAERVGEVPEAVLRNAEALYDGEVESADACVGELLEPLRGTTAWEQTLVVLTADHGECFENGRYFEHDNCLGQGSLRVPLMIRLPGGQGGGRRVEATVGSVDVMPTILGAAGLRVAEGTADRDLLRRSLTDRPVLIQHPLHADRSAGIHEARRRVLRRVAGDPLLPLRRSQVVGLVDHGWKYLRSKGGEELYRLTPVPDERTDLADSEPAAVAERRRRLRAMLARHPRPPRDASTQDDAELIRTLEALGYL